MTTAQLYPFESQTTLTIGSVSLWAHVSGERLAIRVRDTESEIRKRFTTFDWYPVDQRGFQFGIQPSLRVQPAHDLSATPTRQPIGCADRGRREGLQRTGRALNFAS